jgi:2-succinyl-5-enolpyruvyl-6-hydroxy-3-cyclohexene-1-carboxylate synthase
LNLAFREPLVAPAAAVPASARPATVIAPTVEASGAGAPVPEAEARTVVVAGDGAAALRAELAAVVARHGWPVVAEASAGLGAVALPHAPALLAEQSWLADRVPQRAIVVGNPTLHRSLQSLLRAAEHVVVVARGPRWPDAAAVAELVVPPSWLAALAGAPPAAGAAEWAASWVDDAAQRLRKTVRASWPSGPAVAATVYAALPSGSAIQLGSSNPVRDVDLAAEPRDDVTAVANRGLAGIDGTVSSAVGLALARPGLPTYALLGDLTFQHDVTGLVIGPREPRPDLTIVVANDDGGGIFATLEQGARELAEPFERMFGTPTGVRLRELCAAVGAAHREITDPDDLRAAVATPPAGITVLEVRTDRSAVRELHRGLTGR